LTFLFQLLRKCRVWFCGGRGRHAARASAETPPTDGAPRGAAHPEGDAHPEGPIGPRRTAQNLQSVFFCRCNSSEASCLKLVFACGKPYDARHNICKENAIIIDAHRHSIRLVIDVALGPPTAALFPLNLSGTTKSLSQQYLPSAGLN